MDDVNVLLLLGLLERQRMHGYELHEFLEHRLHFVSSLKKATAYRLLDKLHSQGLVDRTVEREGRRPERLVYELTPAGRARLDRLLREELGRAERPVYAGNVALLFVDRLSPSEQAALLRRRRAGLRELRGELSRAVAAHSPGLPARLVLEHDLMHLEAELAWLDRTIAAVEAALPAGSGPPED